MIDTTTHFSFGKNWTSFSRTSLNADRIASARKSFQSLCEGIELNNKRFLDIGFGQGLTLCLANELGADVVGIDIDERNKDALQETLKYFSPTGALPIYIGSILDEALIEKLKAEGPFDIVHSWGVLHHTGDMFKGIDNSMKLVREGGVFIVALYNDHWSSPFWKIIKRLYNNLSKGGQKLLLYALYLPLHFGVRYFTGKSPKDAPRGMDFFHDLVDWVGGFPYEYISLSKAEEYFRAAGFTVLKRIKPVVPTGNHQWVLRRNG